MIETIVEEIDPLAKFREQVRQDDEKPAKKMSETALAKLHAIKEQDRLDAIANGKFATALQSVIVTHDNLVKLITRCNTSIPPKQITRRAAKLGWWIAAGFLLGREIDSVCLINFFSTLVGEEETMADSEFAEIWDAESAEKFKASRIRRGVISESAPKAVSEPVEGVDFVVTRDFNGDVLTIDYLTADTASVWTGLPEPAAPEVRRCASGTKCLQYHARKPGMVKGKGQYCSKNCSDSAVARARREKLASATPSEPSLGVNPV